MANSRCRYIVTPMVLLRQPDIPKDSPVWWRYQMCLAQAWEETGTAYAYFYASNRQLATLWGVEEETARKGLAELVKYRLVETEQVNRTDRIIRILVAWRGQGKDSVPEPRFRVSKVETNAPEPHAPHLPEQQATAAGVPTRNEEPAPRVVLDNARDDLEEGGKQTTTLPPDPNTTTAGIFSFPEIEFKGKTAVAVINRVLTRTREEKFRIQEALDDLGLVDDEAHDELLALRNVTPEYVEDWLMSYILAGKRANGERKLSPGYYRLQMRERREPPYRMSMSQRREYREQKDFEWEQHVTEERLETTQ